MSRKQAWPNEVMTIRRTPKKSTRPRRLSPRPPASAPFTPVLLFVFLPARTQHAPLIAQRRRHRAPSRQTRAGRRPRPLAPPPHPHPGIHYSHRHDRAPRPAPQAGGATRPPQSPHCSARDTVPALSFSAPKNHQAIDRFETATEYESSPIQVPPSRLPVKHPNDRTDPTDDKPPTQQPVNERGARAESRQANKSPAPTIKKNHINPPLTNHPRYTPPPRGTPTAQAEKATWHATPLHATNSTKNPRTKKPKKSPQALQKPTRSNPTRHSPPPQTTQTPPPPPTDPVSHPKRTKTPTHTPPATAEPAGRSIHPLCTPTQPSPPQTNAGW